MANPPELRYTESHEWLRQESDGTLTVGITAHAQDELGELVYVELPDVGRVLAAGEACCVVESTKAASDVYAPLAGTVTARGICPVSALSATSPVGAAEGSVRAIDSGSDRAFVVVGRHQLAEIAGIGRFDPE